MYAAPFKIRVCGKLTRPNNVVINHAIVIRNILKGAVYASKKNLCRNNYFDKNAPKKETPHSFKGQQLEIKSLYRFNLHLEKNLSFNLTSNW